jgi:hypothetical protein
MAEKKTREIRIVIPEEFFALLVPGKAKTHLMNAKKEILLAVRSLIDARIESLEKGAGPKATPRKKVKVE